jgi:hypothetical protein
MKSTFLQITFWTSDSECPEYYLVIIELLDGVPTKNMLITKFPKSPWQFARYPYGIN